VFLITVSWEGLFGTLNPGAASLFESHSTTQNSSVKKSTGNASGSTDSSSWVSSSPGNSGGHSDVSSKSGTSYEGGSGSYESVTDVDPIHAKVLDVNWKGSLSAVPEPQLIWLLAISLGLLSLLRFARRARRTRIN